jgi:AAA family ATP:ADP antiporter
MGALCALAFLLMLSYSIARPATESLFLEAHSSDELPLVWLLVAVAAGVAVVGFARLLARLELARLLGYSSLATGLALVGLLGARQADVPFVHYALYVWKDIYVVLLVETFYCYANAVFPIRTARWVYGLFGIVASLGSLTGNLAVGALAQHIGSANALWAVLPVTILVWLICLPLSKYAGRERRDDEADEQIAPNFTESLRVVKGSSYLLLLVVLIAVVQVAVNLIDYEFNTIVEEAYPDTDQRTAVIGQVYAVLSVATVAFHSLTGPVLRLAGVPLVLLLVPVLLGSGLGAYALAPRFLTIAIVKVASKCFDYTIFRAAKEMLYIPLSYSEKTQGKSIVDVLTYRVAKGGASLVLLGLQRVALVFLVIPLTLGLMAVWFGVTLAVARRFRKKVSREDEMGSRRN